MLPYVREKNLSAFAYGPLCRGLLTGTMRPDTKFTGDDLRQSDPKFQPPRFAQYLNTVQQLDDLAQKRYGKHLMDLAVRKNGCSTSPESPRRCGARAILKSWKLWRAPWAGTSMPMRSERSIRFCARRSPIRRSRIHGAAAEHHCCLAIEEAANHDEFSK